MTRFCARLSLLAALSMGPWLTGTASAGDQRLGDLSIEQPWARASIGPAKAGAAYVTIANHGEETDRLVAATTPAAGKAALHSHLIEDDVMKMRPVEAVEVAPGEPVALRPGGLHIMLMGLKAPLQEGERFPLTLTFEKAGSIELQVEIKSATAVGPDAMDHDPMGHDPMGHDPMGHDKGMEHGDEGDGPNS